MDSDYTIVIPTLNEREGIEKVLDEIESLGIPLSRVLVVDGGSTDGTRDVVRSRGVRIVDQKGRGKADAIRTVADHVDTKYVVIMDGDYTYPAKYIPKILEVIRRGYDLVIGARRRLEPGSQSALYRFGNWFLSRSFNVLFNVRLSDVLSGMYAVRSDVLRELDFESKGFSIESELVAHVVSEGGRVAEVPIEYRRRLGEKKLKVRHGIRIFIDMVRLSWRYYPVVLIFILGALLLIPGLALGAYVTYNYLVHGIKYHVKGLAALSLSSAGLVSLLLAIMSIYMKRMEIRILRRLRELSGT